MTVHKGVYPDHWKRIATRRKRAANWRCARCRHPHDPKAGRCLTVHHFDMNKSNCDPWNLMALCQACHLSVQGRVQPRNPLLIPPAFWAMPHIAGFYEAGYGLPGPLYNLDSWIRQYIEHVGPWPWWAPTSSSQYCRC